MKKSTTRNIVLSGLFIAIGIVLPMIFTGNLAQLGRAFLPMHIPVLIAGFVCGAPYGLVVGFLTPILKSALTSMPPMYPGAVVMAFELAAYGFFAGALYKLFPKKDKYIYPALIFAMLIGRLVWGVASLLILGLGEGKFGWQAFLGGAFINAWMGIVIQIVLIPLIVIAFKRAGFMKNEQ